MEQPLAKASLIKGIIFIVLTITLLPGVGAQDSNDSLNGRNLYRPGSIDIQNDSVNTDSLNARAEFIRDSLAVRLAFIQDSIIAREKFVHDSIQRRKEILDSVTFLKNELPRLLDASLKIISDNIIVNNSKIDIIGDSVLTNYTWIILPFGLDQPFVPWKSTFNLSNKPIKFTIDTINKKITSMQTHLFNNTFVYNQRGKNIRIDGQGNIISNKQGQFYKLPLDSIFFDARNRVTTIKRYIQLYQSINFKKGNLILSYMYQVKQFEYDAADLFTKYKIVNFCERWAAHDPNKVCSIINYAITKQGNNISVARNNDPANQYSDGVFIYEFDQDYTLKNVSFSNQSKSEDWKTIVELNEAGNVSRYVYQNKGIVRRTLLINYYLDDPKAKHKFETITCTFEEDGISYYQVNNTTGKSRVREKMTLEWGPWK